jgi:hypothetical protein
MIDLFENYEPSDKLIQKVKDTLEKVHKREFSWDDEKKLIWNLKSFAEVSFKIADKEIQRRKRLEESPNGLPIDESQPSVLCGNRVVGNESWYDKNGTKCIHCQRALNEKAIPVSALKNREGWYSTFELEQYFNISRKFLGKLFKAGNS